MSVNENRLTMPKRLFFVLVQPVSQSNSIKTSRRIANLFENETKDIDQLTLTLPIDKSNVI